MRLLNTEDEKRLLQVQLYLSAPEARKMIAELEQLVADPEQSEHFHLFSENGGAELICGVVTPRKLASSGYTAGERKAFGNWNPLQ